jgi:nicotinate-nucleotide pyrophosphorylase (carboxylating)
VSHVGESGLCRAVELVESLDIPGVAGVRKLVEMLGGMADPRHVRGIRFRIGTALAVMVFAVLSGARNFREIGDRARDLPEEQLVAGQVVLRVRGPVRGLLTAERTALNLLCHLSGVATATAAWVDVVAGTGTRILDTRKTLPGLRLLQKYAVRCGGGVNHRLGLGDMMLIKDNHVVAAGSVSAALALVRAAGRGVRCEVEVDSLAQLDEVLAENVELVLLDNFTPQQCASAVRRRAEVGSSAEFEVSGGLTLEVARSYAVTGVEFLSAGVLTHSSTALDLGLDLRSVH